MSNKNPNVTNTIAEDAFNDIKDVVFSTTDQLISLAEKHKVPILTMLDFYCSFYTFIVDSVKQKQEESQQEDSKEEDNADASDKD